MRFKQWLLNEGFELPFSVIKDIYEYYRDSYEQYRLKPRVKIEPKYFDLDFTGTRYEFLNDLNPRVLVELKGSLPGGHAGLAYRANLINGRGTAKIQLALVHFVNNPDTIYHEVLHVVQNLIRIKKGMKVIGGLPNMPLVKRITDKRGIDIHGAKNVKRVKHAIRPVEYYTNLDSVIRSLQYKYVRMLLDSGKDMDLGVRDSEAKKEFFYRMKKENSWISDKLDTVNKFDEELYRIYLQEISKRFILNNNFGPDVMPMVTDMGKFLAIDRKSNEDAWKAAAEKAGVSVEELKKRQEQRRKERQEREQELKTKENEKKEQEKSEKTKEEKTNREKLVKQINVYADGGNYGYFSDFNPNFDKLLNLIKQTIKNNGSDTNVLIATNLMGWMGDVRGTLENILDVIKFNHETIDVFKGYKKTREIIANRDEKYNLDSFYMYFGNLKSRKLWYESIKEKEIAKFFELFAEKLAEVFSDALKLGSSGKKLILDNFYRNPVARAAHHSR